MRHAKYHVDMIINGKSIQVPTPLPSLASAVRAKGVTQKQLARAVKDKQPNISRRIKSGKWPTDRFVYERWVAFLFDPKARVPDERRPSTRRRSAKR